MTGNFSQTAAYIWSLADLLRGDFRQSQYGRVILPFTLLRRLECVLEGSKAKVLKQVEKLEAQPELKDTALAWATGELGVQRWATEVDSTFLAQPLLR